MNEEKDGSYKGANGVNPPPLPSSISDHEGPTRTALFGATSTSSRDVAGITTTCSGRRRVEPRADSATGSKKVRERGSSLCA